MSSADYVIAVMEKLSTCLSTAVDEAVSEGVLPMGLCAVGYAPGVAVAYDYVNNTRCLDNKTDGQGFVIMTGLYPSQRFPEPLQTATGCGGADLAINVNVGIIRSYPIREDAEPLPVRQQQALALVQYEEMGLIQNVLTCCYPQKADATVLLGAYTPVGPDGAAVGGYWSATIEGSEDS